MQIQWEITPAYPDFIKLNANGNALINARRDVRGRFKMCGPSLDCWFVKVYFHQYNH